MISTGTGRAALMIGVCIGLSACTQSSLRLQPDFGEAVRQNAVAQIADPDARYEGMPAPGASGARVGLAQKRYQANDVIKPSAVTASSAGSIGSADNGGGGAASSGVGVSAGMSH